MTTKQSHTNWQRAEKRKVQSKNKKEVKITDRIYPLVKLPEKKYEIKDHINLSGSNPLKGPDFISLTNVYQAKNGIVVVTLKNGVVPNKKEKNILLKAGVKAYSYTLAHRVIKLAKEGKKVKACGIVK